MDTAKIQTLKNHTTGDAVAPRTVMEAVTGLTEALADKAEKSALDEKANVADLVEKADTTYVDTAVATKQDKLTGTSGQIVGFDEAGNAVAQDAPRSSSAYVHRFEIKDWTQATEQEEYTITVNSDTHKMAGSIVSCIAMVKDANSYLQTAFGAVQTYATIDAEAENVITIHAQEAYTGLAILTAYE